MSTEPTSSASIRRRVIYSTASNYIGRIIILGTSFLLTPFVLHALGAGTYGLWALVNSVVAYGSLLDLGIASAVIKYVAEYHARGEIKQAQSLVATALSIYTALGLVVIAVGILIAPLFPRLFNVPANDQQIVIWLVILSSINLGISIPAATTWAVMYGLQRFDLLNLISATGTVISALATVGALLAGAGVIGVVVVSLVTTVIMQIPSIWIIRRLAPDLHFGWRSASRQLLRTVASFSSSLFVVNIASQLKVKTDEIVIGASLPISSVTPYNIARRLSDVVQQLTDQFMKVLLPLASELHAGRDRARLRSLYIVSTRLTLLIYIPLGCVIVILARQLLTFWVGAEYADYAHLILILTLAGLIETSQWPAGSVLQGMARHRPLAVMAICSGVANLALSIILVHQIGITGVALGTLIPTTIECIFFVAPYAMRVIDVNMRAMFKEVLWPALLPAVPAAIVLILLREAFNASSLLSIVVTAAAGVGMYYGAYLLVGASADERHTYREFAFSAARSARAYVRAWLSSRATSV